MRIQAGAPIGEATIAVAVRLGKEMAEVGDKTAVVVGMGKVAVVIWTGVAVGLRRGPLRRTSGRKGACRKKVSNAAVPTVTTVVVKKRKWARVKLAKGRAPHPQQARVMQPTVRAMHPRAKVVRQRARWGAKGNLLVHLGPTAPLLQYLLHSRACKIVRRRALVACSACHLDLQQRSTWSISDSGRMRFPITVRTMEP